MHIFQQQCYFSTRIRKGKQQDSTSPGATLPKEASRRWKSWPKNQRRTYIWTWNFLQKPTSNIFIWTLSNALCSFSTNYAVYSLVHNSPIGWDSSSKISGAANYWVRVCFTFHDRLEKIMKFPVFHVLETKIRIFNWLGGVASLKISNK